MTPDNEFGRVLDADTNAPVIGAIFTEVNNPSNTTLTDGNGEWQMTVTDPSSVISLIASGYGSAGGNLSGLSGDFFIYKTDAPVMVKASAIIKNNWIGFVITIILITALIHFSKRFI